MNTINIYADWFYLYLYRVVRLRCWIYCRTIAWFIHNHVNNYMGTVGYST